MFSISGGLMRVCGGWSRRDFLHVGALPIVGLGLPQVLQAPAAAAVPADQLSCIFVYLWGAPSHYESFDPKPDLPAEVRSRYKPIPTNVDGIQVSEHLPRLARQADLYTLVRCMHHDINIHPIAGHLAMTGIRTSAGLEGPNHGAVVSKFLEPRNALPTFVRVGKRLTDEPIVPTGQDGGFLGNTYQPFEVPDAKAPLDKIASLALPEGVTPSRMERRKTTLRLLDQFQSQVESAAAVTQAAAYQRALALVTAPEAKQAFDLGREPEALRDRYGRSDFGQNCLLARRLVESGVRFVQVNWSSHPVRDRGWDSHGSSFGGAVHNLHEFHLPTLDQSLSALFQDLKDRGMLEKTLVVVTGEFGRTMQINNSGGRDHWAGVYTSLLAGAGLRGGRAIGASDAQGVYPDGISASPEDLTMDIYRILGLDISNTLRQAQIVKDAPGIPGLLG